MKETERLTDVYEVARKLEIPVEENERLTDGYRVTREASETSKDEN